MLRIEDGNKQASASPTLGVEPCQLQADQAVSKLPASSASSTLRDAVTGWIVPDKPPADIELTSEQFDELRELLAHEQCPKQDCSQQALNDAGYSCWLEYMMSRLVFVIDRD